MIQHQFDLSLPYYRFLNFGKYEDSIGRISATIEKGINSISFGRYVDGIA